MAPDARTLRLAYVALVTVCVAWGGSYLAISVALHGIPPALIGGLRYVTAGGVLMLALVARGERLPGRESWPGLFLLGFLMLVVGNGGVIWAEQFVPSGIAAVLVASAPFWTNGIEAITPGGARLTSRTLLGLLIGFSGIVLLVWPRLTVGGVEGRQFTLGVAALQVAAIGWSAGSIYSSRHARHENALGAAAVQMFAGGLIMALLGTALGEWSRLAPTPQALWAMFYLVTIGSIAGYSAYVFALKHLPIATVSLYAYVNPVLAVVAGSVIADEPFGWRVVIAGALVLLGIMVVRSRSAVTGQRSKEST